MRKKKESVGEEKKERTGFGVQRPVFDPPIFRRNRIIHGSSIINLNQPIPMGWMVEGKFFFVSFLFLCIIRR